MPDSNRFILRGTNLGIVFRISEGMRPPVLQSPNHPQNSYCAGIVTARISRQHILGRRVNCRLEEQGQQ